MSNVSIEIRKVDFSKNVKANADITLKFEEGDVTLKGFRVIQVEGKDAWVALPSTSYKDKAGEYKNFQTVEMSKTLKNQISKLVLQEYEAMK